MTMTSLGGVVVYPNFLAHASGTGAFAFSNSLQMNDSDDQVNFIIQVPKTGTLDQFEFRTGTVTTFPGNGLRLSFQDVDTAHWYPDGVVDQYATITVSPGSNSWATPPNALTNDGTGGGTKRSVTAGDYLACVIDFLPTFTTGNISVAHFGNTLAEFGLLPYVNFYETAHVIGSGQVPAIALKYSDGNYYMVGGAFPFSAVNTHTYNSGSTPDEFALYFTLPMDMKVMGAFIRMDLDAQCDFVLYDTDGTTTLTSARLEAPPRASGNGQGLNVIFDDPVDLDTTTGYRLSVKPTGGSNISLYSFDVASAARMDGVPGGQAFHHSTQTNGGGWTQTTTRRPAIALLVSHIDLTTTPNPVAGGAHIIGGGIVR